MSNASRIFEPLPTLSVTEWSAEMLRKRYGWGDRTGGSSIINNLIVRNRRGFDFLGVKAEVVENCGRLALRLTTSNYSGAIPLFSPIDGKAAGDLCVAGRFGENASDLIDLMADELNPQYDDGLILCGDTRLKAPLYLECCKYIDAYIVARKLKWRKFSVQMLPEKRPSGSTVWSEYALRTAKNPAEISRFVNRRNLLTSDHEEWRRLTYVLSVAIGIIDSPQTPESTRRAYGERIAMLSKLCRESQTSPTSEFAIHHSDPPAIVTLKSIANNILGHRNHDRLAWRIDYNRFFERYIQYLLRQAALKCGAEVKDNPHYPIHSSMRGGWALRYLEPDAVVVMGEGQIPVDAKYKSHIFNINSDRTDDLYESFRHDLHQVVAYAAFSKDEAKRAVLAYPSNEARSYTQRIISAINGCEVKVTLAGIPINRQKLASTADFLLSILKG